MSNAHYTDAAVAKLRAIIANIELEMEQAPPSPTLQAAWGQLVAVLALGAAPPTRECPTCHGTGMRAASRCSHCWGALEPLPPLAVGQEHS